MCGTKWFETQALMLREGCNKLYDNSKVVHAAIPTENEDPDPTFPGSSSWPDQSVCEMMQEEACTVCRSEMENSKHYMYPTPSVMVIEGVWPEVKTVEVVKDQTTWPCPESMKRPSQVEDHIGPYNNSNCNARNDAAWLAGVYKTDKQTKNNNAKNNAITMQHNNATQCTEHAQNAEWHA